MNDSIDEHWMREAMSEARLGQAEGEFPYGAVLVGPEGDLVARAHDTVAADGDMSSHAETMLVKAACRLRGPDLGGSTLYTTCEPCPMCFTTAFLARVSRIVYGTTMAAVAARTGGAVRELAVPVEQMNALAGGSLELRGGVLAGACLEMFEPCESTSE